MNWKIKGWLFLFLIACTDSPDQAVSELLPKQTLIEVDDLVKVINHPSVKLIDFRKEEMYTKGHIPGALNLWRRDIENKEFPYNGAIATKNSLEELLGKVGIGNQDLLVVYDDVGSCDAARFWWVMNHYSFTNVKILNGGLGAWLEKDRKTTTEVPKVIATTFKFEAPPSNSLTTADELSGVLDSEKVVILDTRTADEFSGKRQKKGASAGGRIPNAIHVDWVENIHFNGDMKFKSTDELNKLYSTIIPSKDSPVITYCQTGVRSSLTYFALTEILGYTNVKNYDGSWAEWSYLENPFLQDSTTTIFE